MILKDYIVYLEIILIYFIINKGLINVQYILRGANIKG